MSPPFDLDAYLARLGYSGPRTPVHALLTELHLRHTLAIPFENLDVLMGRRITTDATALVEKLVRNQRGGYCFEHNSLFLLALKSLGFSATPLLARVCWQTTSDIVTPLTHMVLRVELDGKSYLADVGFGGVALAAPLQFQDGLEQQTAFDLRRLVRSGRTWTAQVYFAGTWENLYRIDGDAPPPVDFELGNWYCCSHPQSHFTNNLIVARATKAERYAIRNREFIVRQPDGRAEKREIASPDELLEILRTRFDLPFPAGTRFTATNLVW